MILFLQQGGHAIAPLVSYEPVTVTGGRESAGAAALAASSSSSSNLTDKDFLKMVDKLEGLPNDTNAVILQLQNFYIDLQHSLTPNTSSLEMRYLAAVGLLNNIKFARKMYDEAYDIVSKNGGLNEFAIDTSGRLIAMNKEMDVKYITPLEVSKLPEGYLLVRNSELLALRANSPQLTGNTAVIDLVKNGIGMEAVTKMIKDSIMSLGTNETKEEGFAVTNKGEMISGLADFLKAQQLSGQFNASVNDLYKGSYLTKTQAQAAQKAISYIYSTLPQNAKTLLKTKTSTGSDKEAMDLVGILVNSSVSNTSQFTLDIDGASASKTEGKRKESSDEQFKMGIVGDIQNAKGGHDTWYKLDNGSGIEMSIPGKYYEQIKTVDGKDIYNTSMQHLLGDSGLRSIINADKGIFFGNLKIQLSDLKNIAYDGNGVLRANLPIKSDGSPNFDLLDDYSKYLAEVDMGADPKRVLSKYPNLRGYIGIDGKQKKDKFAPFIIASGTTTNGLINIDKQNEYVVEKSPDAKQVADLKSSLTEGTGKNAVTPNIDEYDWTEWLMPSFINDYDHMYKGNIYIPVNPNKRAAAYGENQKLPMDEADNLEMEYLLRGLNYNSGSANLLNN